MNPMTAREDANVMEVEEELKNSETDLLTRFTKLQIIDSNRESYKRQKESLKKTLQIWNRSYNSNQEIHKPSSRKGKEKMDRDSEPEFISSVKVLILMGDIVSGLGHYGEEMVRMARNRAKNEENWMAHSRAGAQVFKRLTEIVQLVNYATKQMKKKIREKKEEELYVKIEEIMCRLEEIYGVYLDNNCPEIGIVLQRNCTDLELERCEIWFKQCMIHLDALTWGLGMLRCYAKFNFLFS